jgi:hypothetical protein
MHVLAYFGRFDSEVYDAGHQKEKQRELDDTHEKSDPKCVAQYLPDSVVFARSFSAGNKYLGSISEAYTNHSKCKIDEPNEGNSTHSVAIYLRYEIIVDENNDELNEDSQTNGQSYLGHAPGANV